MFCYVNSVFAPGLDEGVGALWRVSFFFSLSLLISPVEKFPGGGVGWKVKGEGGVGVVR